MSEKPASLRRKKETLKEDLYEKITNKIVAALEQGVRPWSQPWNAEHAAGRITRPLRSNGIPYQGINVLLLWAESTERGFENPYWCTYKQASDVGGQVRKGEKGSIVVYTDKIINKEEGSNDEKVIPFFEKLCCLQRFTSRGPAAAFPCDCRSRP